MFWFRLGLIVLVGLHQKRHSPGPHLYRHLYRPTKFQTNLHFSSRCTWRPVFPETHLKTDQTMTNMSPLFNCSPLRTTAKENINRNTCGRGVMCIPLLLPLPRVQRHRQDAADRTVNTGLFSLLSLFLRVSAVTWRNGRQFCNSNIVYLPTLKSQMWACLKHALEIK